MLSVFDKILVKSALSIDMTRFRLKKKRNKKAKHIDELEQPRGAACHKALSNYLFFAITAQPAAAAIARITIAAELPV